MKSTESSTIPCTEYDHEDWDMQLILPDDGSRGRPEDFLHDGQSKEGLKVKECHMFTSEELDALPDWES